MATYSGGIMVNVGYQGYLAQLAALFHLAACSPHVPVHFVVGLRGELWDALDAAAQQLHSMPALVRSDTTLSEMVKESVTRVTFTYYYRTPRLRIVMSSEAMVKKWKNTVFRLWAVETVPVRALEELRLSYP